MIDNVMQKNKIGIKKAADFILLQCGSSTTLDEFESQEKQK